MREGVIKFKCNWTKTEPIDSPVIDELIYWRQVLYEKGFVGVDRKGIGYGNLSSRTVNSEFIITGSGTGGIAQIGKQHFALVTSFNMHRNSVDSAGPVIASSESMTHAVLYLCDPGIGSVIHIHNLNLWRALLRRVPKTGKQAEYGTPEMAKEVIKLYSQTDLKNHGVLVMAGHEEGIVSFGPNVASAAKLLLHWAEQLG